MLLKFSARQAKAGGETAWEGQPSTADKFNVGNKLYISFDSREGL
jgi:hypothetical protein